MCLKYAGEMAHSADPYGKKNRILIGLITRKTNDGVTSTICRKIDLVKVWASAVRSYFDPIFRVNTIFLHCIHTW